MDALKGKMCTKSLDFIWVIPFELGLKKLGLVAFK